MNLEKEIFEIPLIDIMPNRFQPREIFDDEPLQELAQSIKAHGVIQPIIVRKVGDKFEIIAGERRFRASELAGKKTIPALIRDMDNKEAAKVALLENLQRKDLTAIEEARTYQTILKLDNITQEELAENLGKSQSSIANKLRLLNLDESVQIALLNGQISERHARSLLNVQNNDVQKELVERIILNRMTVRQLDEEIKKMENGITSINEHNIDETIDITKHESDENNITNEESINIYKEKEIDNLIKENDELSTILDITSKNENETVQNFKSNIFEILRIEAIDNEDEKEADSPILENSEKEKLQQEETKRILEIDKNSIYDMRFAINNVRQAVQNTKKFGFVVDVEELDYDNEYKFVITIQKSKDNQ